jgi:hypothetical protein
MISATTNEVVVGSQQLSETLGPVCGAQGSDATDELCDEAEGEGGDRDDQ